MTAVPANAAPPGQSPSTAIDLPRQKDTPSTSRFRPATTPSKLMVALVAALTLIIAAGAISLADSLDRGTVIAEASGQRGRMAIAAFDMYRAMSDADSAATSAFLPGQSSDTQLSDDYQNGVSRASTAITTLAAEVTTADQADMVARLSATLPVYTGLVETARTYHRQGLPLGLAYLRSASALVQEDMLPTIDQLQAEATTDLHEAKSDATAFPWPACVALLAAMAWLVHTQVRESRRTKRAVNPGMVIATVAMLALTGWLLVSWGSASSHIEAGHTNGTEPLETLSATHIDIQRARSDEALTLIAQGTDTDYEAEYGAIMTDLIGQDGTEGTLAELAERFDDPQLIAYLDDATAAAQDWQSAHIALRELDDNGDYPGAVASAVGTEAGQAGAAFEALDEALTRANEVAATRFTEETTAAAAALTATGVGFSILTLLATMATAVGIQRRISEYR